MVFRGLVVPVIGSLTLGYGELRGEGEHRRAGCRAAVHYGELKHILGVAGGAGMKIVGSGAGLFATTPAVAALRWEFAIRSGSG